MLSYVLTNRSQAADNNDLKKAQDILNENILRELQYNIKSYAKVKSFSEIAFFKLFKKFFC